MCIEAVQELLSGDLGCLVTAAGAGLGGVCYLRLPLSTASAVGASKMTRLACPWTVVTTAAPATTSNSSSLGSILLGTEK